MSTAGPNSCGTGADDAGTGTVAWSNPGNITASDDSRATANLTAGQVSHYLVATNFSFTLPTGAEILGILVEWERSQGAGFAVKDARIRIVKGGTIGSDDKASGSDWPASDLYASYGGSTYLWALTWVATDITGSTFGAALSATSVSGGQARVDHCRITVTYLDPALVPYPQAETRYSPRIEVVPYGVS